MTEFRYNGKSNTAMFETIFLPKSMNLVSVIEWPSGALSLKTAAESPNMLQLCISAESSAHRLRCNSRTGANRFPAVSFLSTLVRPFATGGSGSHVFLLQFYHPFYYMRQILLLFCLSFSYMKQILLLFCLPFYYMRQICFGILPVILKYGTHSAQKWGLAVPPALRASIIFCI